MSAVLVLSPAGIAEGKRTCSLRWSVSVMLMRCSRNHAFPQHRGARIVQFYYCRRTLDCPIKACLIRLPAYGLGCTSTQSICVILPRIVLSLCLSERHVILRPFQCVLYRAHAPFHVLSLQGLCFSHEPFTPPSDSAPMHAKEVSLSPR